MADRIVGNISIDAIVTKAATTDGDAIDVMHHDIKKTLGGTLSWSQSQEVATAKWYYSASTTATTTAADAIGGFGSHTTYTNGDAIDTAADVRIVYIEHLGVDENGVASADTDYLTITADAGGSSQTDALCLEPGESILLKFKLATGVPISDLHIDMTANTAKYKIVAMCDDGA